MGLSSARLGASGTLAYVPSAGHLRWVGIDDQTRSAANLGSRERPQQNTHHSACFQPRKSTRRKTQGLGRRGSDANAHGSFMSRDAPPRRALYVPSRKTSSAAVIAISRAGAAHAWRKKAPEVAILRRCVGGWVGTGGGKALHVPLRAAQHVHRGNLGCNSCPVDAAFFSVGPLGSLGGGCVPTHRPWTPRCKGGLSARGPPGQSQVRAVTSVSVADALGVKSMLPIGESIPHAVFPPLLWCRAI